MGLNNLNRKQFKRFQELLSFFEILGVSEEDLRSIPKIKTFIDITQNTTSPVVAISPDESKKINSETENKITDEEALTKMFNSPVQEFYPNGKPKEKHN